MIDASIIDPIEHPNQHVEAHVDEPDEEDSENDHELSCGFERVPQPEDSETDDVAGVPARKFKEAKREVQMHKNRQERSPQKAVLRGSDWWTPERLRRK